MRTLAALVALLGASLLAGCHLVFELDAAPDASDGPILPPRCLSADFEDGERDDGWTIEKATNNPITIEEANGRLELRFTTLMTGNNGLLTVALQDLTNGSVDLEVLDAPPINTGVDLSAALDAMNYYRFSIVQSVAASELQFQRVVSGGVAFTSAAYQPAKHKFLRLRHEGSTMHWETSDGVQWATAHTMDALVDVTELRLRIGGLAFSGGPGANEIIRVDDLKVDLPTCDP